MAPDRGDGDSARVEGEDIARGSDPAQAAEEKAGALRKKAVLGAIWTISTSVGSRALGLVGTLMLTRFLDPETYGEASLAANIVLTAQMLSSSGLTLYLVAKPKEGRAAAFHVTFYFIVLGTTGLIVTVLLRDVFGRGH